MCTSSLVNKQYSIQRAFSSNPFHVRTPSYPRPQGFPGQSCPTSNVSTILGQYRKIPNISPGLYIFQSLFEGPIFGGACNRKFAF